MTPELEARMTAADGAITTVLDRWDPPSPYLSYVEFSRALGDAHRARAAVWSDVITHITSHPDTAPTGLLYQGVCLAREYDRSAADDCERAARSAERAAEQAARLEAA